MSIQEKLAAYIGDMPETKLFRYTTNIANVTIDMMTISMIWMNSTK